MSKENVGKRIEEVLSKIRPYLQDEGGDVILNRYEDGVAYVSLRGVCAGCPMANVTLENVVEEALTQEIEEVVKVIGED